MTPPPATASPLPADPPAEAPPRRAPGPRPAALLTAEPAGDAVDAAGEAPPASADAAAEPEPAALASAPGEGPVDASTAAVPGDASAADAVVPSRRKGFGAAAEPGAAAGQGAAGDAESIWHGRAVAAGPAEGAARLPAPAVGPLGHTGAAADRPPAEGLRGGPAQAPGPPAGAAPGTPAGAGGAGAAEAGARAEDTGAAGAGGAAPAPPGRKGATRRRGPADPVREVLHRHRDLIDGAVDAWEIAAGLEARGFSDTDARRLRHRDVFGLAEELYARAPGPRPVRGPGVAAHAAAAPAGRGLPAPEAAAAYLLPGAVCAVAPRPLTAVLLVLAAGALTRWRGPLRAGSRAAALWTCVLLALTLPGQGRATLTALALSLLPAAYAAHWFAFRARARLAPSHGLSDFAGAVRPRLATALTGYAGVLLALLSALPGSTAVAGPAALGVLLFTARLPAVHGQPGPAAPVLASACAAQALYTLASTRAWRARPAPRKR